MAYKQLVAELLNHIGGAENIDQVTHCATRLRLVLKDESKVNKDKVDSLDKVAGSVFSGGQYQVIVGTNVPDVYQAFITGLGGAVGGDYIESDNKEANLFNYFFKTLVAIMSPTFGVMGAVGVMKGLLSLSIALGWLTDASGAYQIWYAVADGFLYFLPIWVGFNASKVFGGNSFIGAMLAAGLLYPNIVTSVNEGANLTFFGIPIVLANYTQSLFPAMVSSWVAAKLEKFFQKVLPEMLRLMFVPFFTVVLTAPFVFLVVGPLMTWLSSSVASLIMGIYNISPILFGIVGGAFWQVIVIFGLHYAFIPLLINNIMTLGQDPLNAVFQVSVFALAGTAIGYAIKTKNKEGRTLGFSTGLTGLMGVTEPIIYSIALPVRRQFIYAFVGGAVGGLIQALNKAVIYNFGNGGFLGIPLFISPEGKLSSMYSFIFAAFLAFTIPLVLTLVFGTGEAKK